jgi:hypothetical protein
MKVSIRILTILLCSGFLSGVLSAPALGKKMKPSVSKADRHIVVFAHKTDRGVEYRMNKQSYTAEELNYALGELHIDAGKRSGVAVVLEDNMQLSDVKAVPGMALRAGFADVRVYVYWKGTGHMAEVLFGPVLKFSADAKNL